MYSLSKIDCNADINFSPDFIINVQVSALLFGFLSFKGVRLFAFLVCLNLTMLSIEALALSDQPKNIILGSILLPFWFSVFCLFFLKFMIHFLD